MDTNTTLLVELNSTTRRIHDDLPLRPTNHTHSPLILPSVPHLRRPASGAQSSSPPSSAPDGKTWNTPSRSVSSWLLVSGRSRPPQPEPTRFPRRAPPRAEPHTPSSPGTLSAHAFISWRSSCFKRAGDHPMVRDRLWGVSVGVGPERLMSEGVSSGGKLIRGRWPMHTGLVTYVRLHPCNSGRVK